MAQAAQQNNIGKITLAVGGGDDNAFCYSAVTREITILILLFGTLGGDGRNAEYDVLIVCSETKKLFVGSAKVRAGSRAVDELVSYLQQVHEFLPQYQEYEAVGAIGGERVRRRSREIRAEERALCVDPSPECDANR